MAQTDLSGLSDDDLLRAAQPPAPSVKSAAGPSDDELLRAVGQAPKPIAASDIAADVGKSFGSRMLSGAAGLADLPSDIVSGVMHMGERATGYDIPDWVERGVLASNPLTMQSGIRGSRASDDLRSSLPQGAMDYEAKTRAGRYAGAIGEAVPSSVAIAATGGAGALPAIGRGIASAVAPAVGGEYLAEKAKEYYPHSQWAEPAARLAGSIFGGYAANKLENGVRSIISPAGGADPARLQAAADMRARGVPVTAGRATNNPNIVGMEADTPAGQAIAGAAPDSPQAKAFTSATMKFLGSADDLATPQAMNTARSRIVGDMRDALDQVVVPPSLPFSTKVSEAAKFYQERTPSSEKLPLIRNIISRINQGQPIDADVLTAWRSNLGELLYHPNSGISGTAFRLRDAIDDAIENSMRAMGQPERIAAWRLARDQYRNYLAVEDALKVTKATGLEGVITPKDLMAALAKQDKSGIVTGARGEIGDFARSGMQLLTPLPAAGRHGLLDTAVRRAGPLATAAGMGFGALQAAQFAGLSPALTAAGVAAGVARPLYQGAKDAIASQAMRPAVQRYLENQLVNSSNDIGNIEAGLRGGMSTALTDRTERKAGGRVGVNHDKLADQLVGAAERAKKGISKGTETLLDMPDDHIAHALEVANRSI